MLLDLRITEVCGKHAGLKLHNWSQVVQEEQKGHLDSELATVISSVALACKQIASLVTRSGISNLTGVAGAANFSVSE